MLFLDAEALAARLSPGSLIDALDRAFRADIRGELSELARGSVIGRREPGEITLFKSVGCALEDLAAAQLAVSGE
jgi:alanine dehydrogenase